MRILIGIITLSLSVGHGINPYLGWGVLGLGIIIQGVFCKPPFDIEKQLL